MIRLTFALAAGLLIGACSSNGSLANRSALMPSAVQRPLTAKGSPIQHVIFIVQENRSFNNLFFGYPGAKTKSYGYDSKGDRIALQPADLATAWDIGHVSKAFFAACDGRGKLPGTHCKMDGWDKELTTPGAPHDAQYMYVSKSQIEPYWKMARQYVLADRMFASNLDGSFIAHQYIVAAYASHGVDFPFGAWGCEGASYDDMATLTPKRAYGKNISVCLNNPTIANEADTAGITWRFYAGATGGDGGLWSSYQADKAIYFGPDWTADVINPPSQFLTDIGNGKLANITWIAPTYENSDHPGANASGGPAWVASLVNAVGESQYWDSSAIFIMWDDWGGWFDPVKPVLEDYDGLGFRVPLIMISPYAKSGSVTHVQYETASVLRFIEDNFGLAPLAKSDARANDPAADPSAFDYAQKPRAFKKIRGGKPNSFWIERDGSPRWNAKPPHIIGDD